MEKSNINPWISLWTKPRLTIRSLLESNPKKVILWLAMLSGIISMLFFAVESWQTPRTPWHSTLLIVSLVIIGVILGIFHLYFTSWLLKLTGEWVGGKGAFIGVKCAVGWSNYPFLIATFLALISAFLMRGEPTTQPALISAIVIGWLYLVAAIWAFVIFLKIIGEAHTFSVWKSLLALLIAIVLIFVVLMLIALLIPLIAPLFK